MLAAVEAARRIDPDLVKAKFLRACLHVAAKDDRALVLTAAARVLRRPLIDAHEHVAAVKERFRHSSRPMSNALALASSPYLQQHRDNPVHWVQWGADAFARAEAENRPILLSIGYAACHWCHVMAHESFEDEATARLMNENFVCVKVDREERPDLDLVYQSALAALDTQGGWPLTMFLASDGTPFWGGTYFPPEPRWGRPGFPDILERITHIYRSAPDKVLESTREMGAILQSLSTPPAAGPQVQLTPAFLDRAAEALLGAMDPVYGGFHGAPKFPQFTSLELLWRAHLRGGPDGAAEAVKLALEGMSRGGIYDHLGGGIARYATDEAWLVPHFEKMLYDNALFVDLMTWVWRSTGAPAYAQRVQETVAWALREMTAPSGAFISSYDADSDGEEGQYYVWTADDIDGLLGGDAPLFRRTYGVTADGNWEGKNILSLQAAFDDEATKETLVRARRTLAEARARRMPPARDDKILADWNGLMIAALAEAGTAFAQREWIAAAERAFTAIVDAQSEGDRLFHASCNGRLARIGFLDDYAAMARAALALFETTGNAAYLERARAWIGILDTEYRDAAADGYYTAAADGDARLLVRPRHAHDSAQPSGNGLTAQVLARLFHLTGDDTYRVGAQAILEAFAAEAPRQPVALASILNAYDLLSGAVQIVVIGTRGEAGTEAIVHAALSCPSPNRILLVATPREDLPPAHPAAGKSALDGKPTAYVCIGPTCSAPVTEAAALRTALRTVIP